MASKVVENFVKYWAQIHGIIGVAIVLHPRCKNKILEYYYPFLMVMKWQRWSC